MAEFDWSRYLSQMTSGDDTPQAQQPAEPVEIYPTPILKLRDPVPAECVQPGERKDLFFDLPDPLGLQRSAPEGTDCPPPGVSNAVPSDDSQGAPPSSGEAEIIELPIARLLASEHLSEQAQDGSFDEAAEPLASGVVEQDKVNEEMVASSLVSSAEEDATAQDQTPESNALDDETVETPMPSADRLQFSELGRALLAHRLITEQQLREATAAADELGAPLESVLVQRGYVGEEQILQARAAIRGVMTWDPATEEPDPEALAKVPAAVCRRHIVLPVRVSGTLLTLAMANTEDMGAVEAVRRATGLRIEPRAAAERKLRAAINRHYGQATGGGALGALIEEAQKELGHRMRVRRDPDSLTEEDTRPVVGLVNHLLTDAIRMGASDVHIEPKESRVDVRMRLDGEMQKCHEIPAALLPPLATRLRIMADLDIVDWRMPQDGRMSVNLDGRRVDVRVSVLPSLRGPRIVLRILDRALTLMDLADLGMQPTKLAMFRSMISRPYGLLLVTGPTGSGKTTTLYAALRELKATGKNIMTAEDPVEYELEGVSQSQVNEKIGLTFAAQLRAILRQDPDVVLVGEIRDGETAETAIRAALTGHLVLSTLHCTDAPGAIPRLLDMGVNPYLLSTSLIGVTAQRLIRTLCNECSEPAEGGRDVEMLAAVVGESLLGRLRKPVGCEVCFNTGYRGRAAVHEILPVSPAVASAIANREPLPVLRDMAAGFGYEPLQVDAIRRVLAGETTLEEARRTIAFDAEPPSNDPLGTTLPKPEGTLGSFTSRLERA
jgi:type IV pilus assembly protein PilB